MELKEQLDGMSQTIGIIEVKSDELILARLVPSSCWKKGLTFYSVDEEFIQVGSWRYNKGKELYDHKHISLSREIMKTQEVLYIKRGKIMARIFNDAKSLIAEIIAEEGDTLIMLNGGHGYLILDDDTQVLEIKNGPYLGAEVDRERF